MLRPAVVLLLIVMLVAGCATEAPASTQAGEAAATAASTATPEPAEQAETPEPTEVALDAECLAAFEAGAEAMREESVDHLDAAIVACETVDDWVAGGRMFPDAVGFRIMELVYLRCSGVEELQSSALCQATEEDWSSD